MFIKTERREVWGDNQNLHTIYSNKWVPGPCLAFLKNTDQIGDKELWTELRYLRCCKEKMIERSIERLFCSRTDQSAYGGRENRTHNNGDGAYAIHLDFEWGTGRRGAVLAFWDGGK